MLIYADLSQTQRWFLHETDAAWQMQHADQVRCIYPGEVQIDSNQTEQQQARLSHSTQHLNRTMTDEHGPSSANTVLGAGSLSAGPQSAPHSPAHQRRAQPPNFSYPLNAPHNKYITNTKQQLSNSCAMTQPGKGLRRTMLHCFWGPFRRQGGDGGCEKGQGMKRPLFESYGKCEIVY